MTQHGHAGRHHGRGTPDCPAELHHHHDERCVSPLDDRRQRAREAYADLLDESAHVAGWPTAVDISTRRINALNEAIETATRVQITPEVMRAATRENIHGPVSSEAVRAALAALGFEVVE
jgi:hypothetical protein